MDFDPAVKHAVLYELYINPINQKAHKMYRCTRQKAYKDFLHFIEVEHMLVGDVAWCV